MKFQTKQALLVLVKAYFDQVENNDNNHNQPHDKKTNIQKSEPATIAGLALYLGFNSHEEFDEYEHTGKFADIIKRARFMVEAAYEKKLHQQPSSGVIFALKAMGWNEKPEIKPSAKLPKTLKIQIIETGPKPASNEKEVIF